MMHLRMWQESREDYQEVILQQAFLAQQAFLGVTQVYLSPQLALSLLYFP